MSGTGSPIRTDDHRHIRPVLCLAELSQWRDGAGGLVRTGHLGHVGPALFRLSYSSVALVRAAGFEPATSCLRGRRAARTALHPEVKHGCGWWNRRIRRERIRSHAMRSEGARPGWRATATLGRVPGNCCAGRANLAVGGPDGNRTRVLFADNEARPHCATGPLLVEPAGFEPASAFVRRRCSSRRARAPVSSNAGRDLAGQDGVAPPPRRSSTIRSTV